MFLKRPLILGLVAILLAAGCAPVQKLVLKPGEVPPGPTPTAAPTAVPTPSGNVLALAFTGDIMMGGSAAYKLKTEGPDSFFTYTTPLLRQADIAMGNLEGPLGLKSEVRVKARKQYTFLVDPSAATGLAHAGFKLLTLANNHTMDFGHEALQTTLRALDSVGLKHTGAGMNLDLARQPAWFEVKGRKVAVLAYSLTKPVQFWATKTRPGCATAYAALMKEDIEAAKAKGANLVIVCCHWGKEKHTKLEPYQPLLAHLAIDSGADAVVCHHPHIWQGLEVYEGKPIAYSIGNFCFGSLSRHATQSGMLFLYFDEKNQWAGGRIVPLNVNNYQVDFAAQPMTEKNAGYFMEYLQKLSKTADLSMAGSEIVWAAPTPTPTGVAASTPNGSMSPVATLTAGSLLQTPTPTSTFQAVDTATPDPAGNPEGSVPGVGKP